MKQNSLAVKLSKSQLLSEGDVEKALVLQKKNGGSLLSVLVDQGLLDEEQIARYLAEATQCPYLDLTQFDIDPTVAGLIPPHLARKHQAIPISKASRNLVVALADPTNIYAIDDLTQVTSMQIQVVVSKVSDINSAIEKSYAPQRSVSDAADNLDSIEAKPQQAGGVRDSLMVDGSAEASSDPIISFVNSMLSEAIRLGVSDIHIEPYEKWTRVRFRKDGTLVEKVKPPSHVAGAIVSRIKILSRLDIAEKRRPQDGRMKAQLESGKSVDFRVSVIPTVHGEKIVMRILDKSNLNVKIKDLGFTEHEQKILIKNLHQSQGMILVTGPTGSGKTTTLYSFINHLNTTEKNISTAEDPVEYKLDGVNQVQIRSDIDFDFASALRSFLRQDPDIILVGEIRDNETAGVAFKAASTGHLVLSTLHTNDTLSTIYRLIDLGVPAFMVAETVSVIMAQRLMKKLCKSCSEEFTIDKGTLLEMGVAESEISKYSRVKKKKGCNSCGQTGYRGRMPIFEILEIDFDIKKKIIAGEKPAHIKKYLIQSGQLRSLRMAALEKFAQGLTSIEEVNYLSQSG